MFKNTYNKSHQHIKSLLTLLFIFCFCKINGQKKLLEAMEKNDTATFDKILSSGVNVNKRKLIIRTRYGIPRKRRSRSGKVVINRAARRRAPLIFVTRTELPVTEAAFKENYYFVDQLLRHGANPNKKGNYVLPPLAWAAHHGNLELVKLLLENKADINGSERKNRTTPLIEAIEWKHWEVAKYLIARGADLHKTDDVGKTALSHAAIQKNVDLVKILVERGGDLNHKDNNDQCILEDACSDDKLFAETETNFEVIRFLVEHGASTNNNAIGKVVQKGESAIAKYLIDKKAPVSNSLVLRGANGKNFELFRYLVDTLHLGIHYKDSPGYWRENVLHVVCSGYWDDSTIRRVNIPMLSYILERGVSVNDTNSRGQTPLLLLIEYGKKDEAAKTATTLLISKGADVNISGGDLKFSPLMHAASGRHFETAKVLIENGADVNYKDHENRTILHWAAWQRDNEKVIELLVKHGANINAIDERGQTPAMSCITFDRWENIKMLVELGADLNIRDKFGHTLLDGVDDEETRELIIKKGGKRGKE